MIVGIGAVAPDVRFGDPAVQALRSGFGSRIPIQTYRLGCRNYIASVHFLKIDMQGDKAAGFTSVFEKLFSRIAPMTEVVAIQPNKNQAST